MANFHLLEAPRVFLAALKARPELRRRVKVVGVTALRLPTEGLGAPYDEIDNYLAMPFDIDELIEKIEAVSAKLREGA